jgi:D-glycero-D-manno-heptose 1,7-bisphosphate phosphatase
VKDQTERAAVFLDRDGTILRDVGYLSFREQIEILPRVPEAIRLLKEKGYKIIVVTNQSGVARGRLSEDQLKQIHEEMRAQLALAGATLDALYYCPHHPSEGVSPYRALCDCRKPNTGMIRKASEQFGLKPGRSYIVGDQVTDMELAVRAGVTGIWICDSVDSEVQACGGTFRTARDLWDAAQWIATNS